MGINPPAGSTLVESQRISVFTKETLLAPGSKITSIEKVDPAGICSGAVVVDMGSNESMTVRSALDWMVWRLENVNIVSGIVITNNVRIPANNNIFFCKTDIL